jgi:DNA-binding PadR family transcriptional regulator
MKKEKANQEAGIRIPEDENFMINGLLKSRLAFIVLSELIDGEKSGYELMGAINEKSGWKPSAGSVYPLLKSLLSDGLVDVREDTFGRRIKYYSITPKGKKIIHYMHEATHLKDFFLKCTMNSVNILKCIEKNPQKRMEQAGRIIASLNDDRHFFPEFNPEMMKLNMLFLKITSKKSISNYKKTRLKKILDGASKSLSELV